MSIWKSELSIEEIQFFAKNTLVEYLDINITNIGEGFVEATMPVKPRTHQPMGILHGGASVVLAETVGSFAAQMAAEPGYCCVGLDINANHLRSVTSGLVTALAKPIHLGRSTQVWNIEITDDKGNMVCVSRLTLAVLKSQEGQ